MSRTLAFFRLVVLLTLMVCAALIGMFAGCTPPRSVTVQGEAPPPTVVTETDTLYLASGPDTLFLPGPERVVMRTVPVEVVRYLAPRPDTSRAYLLWHFAVDSARVEVAGADSDRSFRRPAPGETLACTARGPSELECRVEGVPAKPPDREVEVPACPECIIRATTWGKVQTGFYVLVILAAGGLGGLLVGRSLK